MNWHALTSSYRDLPPGTPQPYRYGQNLGFVVARGRQWRSDIEEHTEPGRAQMDIDLIGPDIECGRSGR